MTKISNCVICGSSSFINKYNTYDRHYGNTNTSWLVDQCLNCKVLFLNPMISDDELHSMYDEDTYYSYKPFNSSKRFSLKEIIHNIFINIKPKDYNFNPSGKNILDIGCGSGKELFDYKLKGGNVFGIEISKSASEFGNKFGLNIFNGTLIQANLSSNFFDYIRSNHSFEHLIDPVNIVEEIYRITKPGGKVFIGVPNSNSFNYYLFKRYWYYLGVPFHPFSYNTNNLILLFESKGFKVDRVAYNGNLHGILGSLQIYFNRKNNKSSSEGFISNNFFLKAICHQLAKVFNFFKVGDCIEITFKK
jgi:SAM-dependent methyltransferase